MKAARISIAVAFLHTATLCILSKPTLADEDSKNPLKSFSSAELVRLLDSDDGMNRTAATREMFRRGKQILPQLVKAGAKQMTPVPMGSPKRRLDMVYSIIAGFKPNKRSALAGYKTNGFGVIVEKSVTHEELTKMGKKYGFRVDGKLNPNAFPNAWVILLDGKELSSILRKILSEEPDVINVRLNYFET